MHYCYNLSIPRRGQSKQISFFQNADIEINSTLQKILSTDLNVSYFIQSKSERITQVIMNTVWCEIFAGFLIFVISPVISINKFTPKKLPHIFSAKIFFGVNIL